MKKIKYIALIFIIYFLTIPSIFAETYSYENDFCKDYPDKCLTLCGYTPHDGEKGFSSLFWSFTDETIRIYVDGAFYSFADVMSGENYEYTERIDGNDRVYFEENIMENFLNNGVCPSRFYFDDDAFLEYCFDNNDGYCTSIGAFVSHWYNGSEGYFSLDYTLSDRIYNYLNNITITKDMLENYNTENVKAITENLKNEILYGKQVQSLIKNMDGYKNGFKEIEQKIDSIAESIVEDLNTKYNNNEITNEEYQEQKQRIEENANRFKNELTNFKEKLNSNVSSPLNFSGVVSCSTYLGSGAKGTPLYYLKFAYKLMKYAAIILLFVLTIVDLIKAVTSNKDDEIKKVISSTIKRLIIVILIFLLPTLINFILKLFGVVTTNPTCNIIN